jgi:hypothetical protein
MDDLYVVRVRCSTSRKEPSFHAAVEHVGTRIRFHFASPDELLAFFELRLTGKAEPAPQTPAG